MITNENQENTGKRAAIYTRAAASQESTSSAFTHQVDQCITYCAERGYTVLHMYQDVGFSGTQIDRLQLTALRKAAKRNEIDVLVISSIDRLARKTELTTILVDEFNQQHVTVEIAEPGAETEVQRLAQAVQEGAAETQRELLVKRMQHGKAAKKAQREQQQ